MVRYKDILPTSEIQGLGSIAVDAAVILARIPRPPLLRFYVESFDGDIVRPRPVLGFCNFVRDVPAIFVKADQEPRSLVETIFHEVHHGRILYSERDQQLSQEQRERDANAFQAHVPDGWTCRDLHSEIARRLSKWFVHVGDPNRARKYYAELKSVDPETADKIKAVIDGRFT